MGRNRFRIRWALPLCFLVLFSLLNAQESTGSDGLGFSIQSDDKGHLIWGIKGDQGEILDLPIEEVRTRLTETIFPDTLKKAEVGEFPETWIIGFFYMDGMATDRDLDKAEAAFRKGFEQNNPIGLISLAHHYYNNGKNLRDEREQQTRQFEKAEALVNELIEAGHTGASSLAVKLASVYMFGWHDAEIDLDHSGAILDKAEAADPDNPSILLHQAKIDIYLKKYPEAHDYAARAEQELLKIPNISKSETRDLKRAKASKISALVLDGEISKIDPEEFLAMSKDSLGLNGPLAWAIPLLLVLLFTFLLRRSRKAWNAEENGGPGLWLTITWISASILAAGIGFNIRLPGLDNGIGHWIGAIIVTAFALLAVKSGGCGRYFGTGPLYTGPKNLFKGIGIVVGCVVGMQLIAMGYAKIYELILNRGLDQQLVSLFIKSENLIELAGTVLIVGIAIPFYEEVFFRGFLFDAIDRKWGVKAALIISSFVFAIVHGLTFFVPLLFLSFALGWLRIKTGNLRMSFILHAVNNSTAVLIGYFSSGGN